MFEILAALLLAATFSPGAAQRLEQASSAKNDYNLSYDAREESLVFARSEAEFRNAKIFVSAKRKGRWAAPHPISFSDPRYSDSDPWLTPDGKTLYFVSNRPTAARGSRKDLDIWMSRRLRSGWSAPEHLGDKVNTPGEELGPELHDNVLYFSSTRAGGREGGQSGRLQLHAELQQRHETLPLREQRGSRRAGSRRLGHFRAAASIIAT
jgi:hypothetical protein